MNQQLFDHWELNTCFLVPIYDDITFCTMLNFTQLLRMFCVLAYFGYAMAWIGLVRTFPLAEQTKNNNKRIAANATILDSKRSNQVRRLQQFNELPAEKNCFYTSAI